MHCFICADDEDFLFFINNFIKENNLYVFNVDTQEWSSFIDHKDSSYSSSMLFCYLLDEQSYIEMKNIPYNYKDFSNYIRIQKMFDVGNDISTADIACSNKSSLKQIFLKLKRNAVRNFNKGMKWSNGENNTLLATYLWSSKIDPNKKLYPSGDIGGKNRIIPMNNK